MTTTSVACDTVAVSAEPIVFVDLVAQHAEISTEVAAAMGRVMAEGSFINGTDVQIFERRWAHYCGQPHGVGVANGTDALELSLRAIGVGPGDEVIVPANSFIATAGAVTRTGAKPRFVDCDPVHLLMDPAQVADSVTAQTKAIVPVHLYGQMASMDEICAVAAAAGTAVVEDAAQAHGASQGGRRVGSWGVAAAFSFYPGKNLGAYGDAGAVVTRSELVADTVGALRNHGGVNRYEHRVVGCNSRLDTLQAVVLNVKLDRLDRWNAARQLAAARYQLALAGVDGVTCPSTADGNTHVWHLYVVRVPERDRVLARLQEAGIPAAIHYPTPIHLTAAYAHLGYGPGDFPVAEEAASEILSLPLHPHLSEGQQARIVDALVAAVG